MLYRAVIWILALLWVYPSVAAAEKASVAPVTRFLETEGGRLAYDDSGGAGPAVVMVPGMGDLRQEYRFLSGPLHEAGFRVITMDVRGHGETSVGWDEYSAPAVGGDILALIRHIGAGPAFVIGNSFAAGSAVWAATEAPEAVAGLVLVAPVVRQQEPPGLMRWVLPAAMRVLFWGPWRVPAWLMYYDSLFPLQKPTDFAAYRARLGANLREPGRFEALQRLMTASPASIASSLRPLDTPVLVLMGTKDRDFPDPPAEAAWVATTLGGTFHLIEGAGHYPHSETPAVATPVVVGFLRQQASKDASGQDHGR